MNSIKLRLRLGFLFLAAFAIIIGLYPLRFISLPIENSLLALKPAALISTAWYLPAFYLHISLGGVALLAGFSQFFTKLRVNRPGLHRNLGKLYVMAVAISGFSGLLIAFFANGGLIAALGFGGLAMLWLYTTLRAYTAVRSQRYTDHRRWMIRSYALCFAAVTLRIYLPLMLATGIGFIIAYRIIAWLCWVPNLIVAEYLITGRLGIFSKRAIKGGRPER